MDFADILNGVSRPQKAEDEPFRPGGRAAATPFWQVLDQVADAPPVSDETLKNAYFPDEIAAAEPIVSEADLSLDPEDIADELDLGGAVSVEELSSLRRKFAMLNHPDRVVPALRERANRRMTIANSLIDTAAAQLVRGLS